MIAAAIPLVLLVAREWNAQPDIGRNDYAQYVAHARALLDGRPYADTGYLFSPLRAQFAPRAYPPGLPLALVVGFALAGPSLAAAKVVCLLLSVALLPFAGWYFARESGFGIGLAVALMLSVSPVFVENSLAILSDLPFASAVWLMLLIADRKGSWTLWRSAAVAGAAGAAILIRPHGLVVIPALGLWGILNLRRLGWKALAPTPVVLLATLMGRLIIGPGSLRSFPRFETLTRYLLMPDLRYHLSVLEAHLYPFAGDLANDIFHIFTVGLMLLGLVEFVRRGPLRLSIIFGLTYTLALGAVPYVDLRFAFPLFPLFVFGLLNGVRLAVGALFPDRGRLAAGAWACAFAVVVTVRTLGAEPPRPLRDDPAFRHLVEHVRDRAEQGEALRIASFRPRVLALETGVAGMVLLEAPDPPDHLREWCRLGITHVVLGGFGIGVEGTERSRDAMRSRPDAFSTEYRNERYELVRFDRNRGGCPSAP